MTNDLDIHLASHEEMVAAHRNVFDIWSKGMPLDEHVHHRLNSPSHVRARWFVGTLGGRVVTSLGCYPVSFWILGEELPGIAIGSVYTLTEFRGCGFAPRLLDWVERYERERQAALSVLYSDIDPDYYARLGYVKCPAYEGWREPKSVPTDTNSKSRLVVFSPMKHLPAMMRLYESYHSAAPLAFARGADYWTMLLQKFADDRFYALENQSGNWDGYARIGVKGSAWRITDFALADQSDELADELYAALFHLAAHGGAERFGGWLPDGAVTRKYWELAPRKTEITMVKPLAWSRELGDELIASTSRFCELDHV